MANKTIPELTEKLQLEPSDLLIVHGSGQTKKTNFYNALSLSAENVTGSTKHISEWLSDVNDNTLKIVLLSANNTGIDTGVRSLTGNWQNTSTVVQVNSAQWASNVDTGVRSLTGNWESTYTTVQGNSAQWASNVDTGVRALTSNWQSTYTTVQSNSAQWASNIDTGVRSLTSNWQSTYTTVQSNSAQWASNIDTGVRSLTSNWQNTYTTYSGNSSTYVKTVATTTPGTSAVSTIVAVSAMPVSPDPNTLYIVI